MGRKADELKRWLISFAILLGIAGIVFSFGWLLIHATIPVLTVLLIVFVVCATAAIKEELF